MIEENIFTRAIELPEKEREAFLLEACGDDAALRESVESLLAAHDSELAVVDTPCPEAGEVSSFLNEHFEAVHEEGDSFPWANGLNPERENREIIYFGGYKLIEEIARGAMGVVFRAEQTTLKRIVAIKMIRSTLLASEEDVARFRTEAEAAAGLDHPNIVPIYEIGEHDGQHYFSMKLIDGGTLDSRKDKWREDPRAAAALMVPVAWAIHAAHQKGILHRDIKPGNILIDQDGEPHVTDFGLAKQMESNQSMTLSGQILGTPYYMSPEQADAGGKNVTTAADIYSLGAVLYELLTGRPPHRGESLIGTLKQVINESPPAPRSLNPALDRDLETIVLKCLDKDPQGRYPSAAGLALDLGRWLRGEAVTARPVGTMAKIGKWMRRNPMVASLWSVALASLLGFAVGGPLVALRQTALREEADGATALAKERAAENRRLLYFSDMNQASLTTMNSGGLRIVQDLTERWIPQPGEIDLRGWEWHYLRSVYDHERIYFDLHDHPVVSLDCHPDGERGVSLDSWGLARLWNMQGGVLSQWPSPGLTGLAVRWNPDGSAWASLFDDGKLVIREADGGEIIGNFHFQRGPSPPCPLAWSPDGDRIAVGSRDGHIMVWSVRAGKPVLELRAFDRDVFGLAWSPDGSKLASTGIDLELRIWDSKNGSLLREIRGEKTLKSVSWSPDGRFLAGGVVNMDVVVLDAETLEEAHRFKGHFDYIPSIAWSPDSRRIASASRDFTVRIWDLKRDDEWAVVTCQDRPKSLSWSAGGERIVIGVGKSLRIVDVNQEAVPEMGAPSHLITDLRWSPDGTRIATSGTDGCVRLWDWETRSQAEEFRMEKFGEFVWTARWSPDGDRIAAAGTKIVIRGAADGGKDPIRADSLEGKTWDVDWSPDGSRLATLEQGGWLRVRDSETGVELNRVALGDIPFGSDSGVWWSGDRNRLVVSARGRESGAILVFDSDSLEEIHRFTSEGPEFVAALNAQRDRVAISSLAGTIQILDLDSGVVRRSLMGHDRGTRALEWSPDGERLASAGGDRMIRIWDPDTGGLALTILAHDFPVGYLAWSPEGWRLASASGEQIRIWETSAHPDS